MVHPCKQKYRHAEWVFLEWLHFSHRVLEMVSHGPQLGTKLPPWESSDERVTTSRSTNVLTELGNSERFVHKFHVQWL